MANAAPTTRSPGGKATPPRGRVPELWARWQRESALRSWRSTITNTRPLGTARRHALRGNLQKTMAGLLSQQGPPRASPPPPSTRMSPALVMAHAGAVDPGRGEESPLGAARGSRRGGRRRVVGLRNGQHELSPVDDHGSTPSPGREFR
jgi:hypothetical protein